ncbi:glycosyltransferase [Roseateles sp. P5_D6]
MHANHAVPEQQVQETRPGAGPHLLDVSMFWGATGGVRRVLTAKHERLRPLGWRHTVIAPGAQGPGMVDCGGMPLPRSGGYRMVLGRGRALRQIEFVAPDIVESADPYVLAWASLAAAEQLRIPAVAFCHSNLPQLAARLAGGPEGTRLGRGAERWARRYLVNLYRHFDLVMAPSSGMVQLLQSWGVPRVTLQPLGVDCSAFTPCARDAAWRVQFCSDHGLAPDTRLFIYTGRFALEKNLQLLADAVALLGRGHVLLAVGDGPAPPLGEQVLVLPPEHDSRQLARMVASCDAYVHAGDQETFGLGVLEAMACGTPVVVASAGGLAELARDAGLLVDRPRAGSWAEAMDASLDGNQAVQRRNALARAQAQDWPHVMAQMTRRYTALLGRQPTLVAPARNPALPLANRLARQR